MKRNVFKTLLNNSCPHTLISKLNNTSFLLSYRLFSTLKQSEVKYLTHYDRSL